MTHRLDGTGAEEIIKFANRKKNIFDSEMAFFKKRVCLSLLQVMIFMPKYLEGCVLYIHGILWGENISFFPLVRYFNDSHSPFKKCFTVFISIVLGLEIRNKQKR